MAANWQEDERRQQLLEYAENQMGRYRGTHATHIAIQAACWNWLKERVVFAREVYVSFETTLQELAKLIFSERIRVFNEPRLWASRLLYIENRTGAHGLGPPVPGSRVFYTDDPEFSPVGAEVWHPDELVWLRVYLWGPYIWFEDEEDTTSQLLQEQVAAMEMMMPTVLGDSTWQPYSME